MEVTLFSSLKVPVVVFFISLFARALFSFLETSITALRLFKLKELAAGEKQYKTLFNALEKSPHRVLITILIASNFADVIAASLASYIMETLFAHWQLPSGLGFSLGIGIATISILVFGEIIPKSLAKASGERLFRSSLWIINVIFYTFYSLVTVLLGISSFFVSKITTDDMQEGTEWVSSEKEIQFLIGYIKDKGLMETEKTVMLQNIFDLGLTPVKEVLVPAVDIVSVKASLTSNDVIDIFLSHGFTRLPIYEGKPDNIIGMVHLKDVFALTAKHEIKPLKEIARPILFVPESVKINQLLREFKEQHMHIAIVLNEHGIVTGMVTLEDVLEEIVGEIQDEHERTTQKVTALKGGGWLIDASTPLDDLQEVLGIEFETEGSITLGGFMTEQLQHLPQTGERFLYKDFYFQVKKATEKRVLLVLIFHAHKIGEQSEE